MANLNRNHHREPATLLDHSNTMNQERRPRTRKLAQSYPLIRSTPQSTFTGITGKSLIANERRVTDNRIHLSHVSQLNIKEIGQRQIPLVHTKSSRKLISGFSIHIRVDLHTKDLIHRLSPQYVEPHAGRTEKDASAKAWVHHRIMC